MKKKLSPFLGLVLLFILFLTSCKTKPEQGERPLETEAALKMVQTGTQGLVIKFLPNYPPSTQYDTTEFVAVAEVWNKGRHDLEPGSCFLELKGYDPNIIKSVFPNSRQPCSGAGPLEGKKTYNLEGSFNHIEFRSSDITLPLGISEYPVNLNLVACYSYQTIAAPIVCVENSLYAITSEQKACDYRKSVPLTNGQGAPVGVGYVGVEMAGSKAIFDIQVINYGSGRVVSPQASLADCSNLEYKELDKLQYSVELSGGTLIDCKPLDGLVRLVNNKGKIVCTFDIGNTPAYETPLLIKLSYNYLQSIKKPFKIIKTPGSE